MNLAEALPKGVCVSVHYVFSSSFAIFVQHFDTVDADAMQQNEYLPFYCA